MKTFFSVALVAAMASAATPEMKKLTAFNQLVMNSKVGGKVLHSAIPESKSMLPKPKTMYSYYQEYDWANEDMLAEGCNYETCGDWCSWSWITDMDKCNS